MTAQRSEKEIEITNNLGTFVVGLLYAGLNVNISQTKEQLIKRFIDRVLVIKVQLPHGESTLSRNLEVPITILECEHRTGAYLRGVLEEFRKNATMPTAIAALTTAISQHTQ